MDQYISKSALLAEIERLEKKNKKSEYVYDSLDTEYTLKSILSFVDTLEVKEADAWRLREKENRNMDVLAATIPELGECNDERIRKELIEMVRLSCTNGDDIDKKIAWLEKQNSSKYEKRLEMGNNALMKCLQNSNAQIGMLIEENFNLREELKKQKEQEPVEQKPAWSEEDERERERVVGLLEGWLSTFKETYYAKDCKRGIGWLKVLKDRMTPTNKNDFDRGYEVGISAAKFNQWKPTEGQMKALGDAIFDAEWDHRFKEMDALLSLDKDLKKL